ncbi:Protein of unknown function [Cotesia congregata]|uniref:Uncharacterized protein n=1 Tax=Cotesia congregata TaxID=51543 RepID=A0A8J2HEV0_COTCN|nr:Protein of unknown function [Cotesia congregata]
MKKKGGRKVKAEDRRVYKVGFWNVVGIKNKDEDFWKRLEEWDVVVLIEIWVDKKGWERIKQSWKRGFIWELQEARVQKGRGRAKVGMLVGVKEEIKTGRRNIVSDEGWTENEVKLGNEWWWVVGVYINGDVGRKREDGEEIRNSKVKVVNKEGNELCKFLSERGWAIANGCIKGDEEGEWTFVGERGCSKKITEVKVEKRIESDPMPVVAGIGVKWDISGRGRKRAVKGTTRGIWSKEGIRKFGEEFKEWYGVKRSVEEDWQELKEKARRAIKVTEKIREKKSGK